MLGLSTGVLLQASYEGKWTLLFLQPVTRYTKLIVAVAEITGQLDGCDTINIWLTKEAD